MYAKLLYFVGAICHIYSSTASKVPYIHKCSQSDSACLTKSAMEVLPTFTDGIPDLGVEPMDPMFVDHIDGSTTSMKIFFNNCTMTGLKNCVIHYMKRDVKNDKMYLTVECSTAVTAKYEAEGQILFFKLKGEGDAYFELNKSVYTFDCDVDEEKGDDGKPHFFIKHTAHTIELKDKAVVHLSGLSNNSSIVGQTVNNFFDQNANEIALDMGGPMINVFIDKIVDNIRNFFYAVPMEDLVLDDL